MIVAIFHVFFVEMPNSRSISALFYRMKPRRSKRRQGEEGKRKTCLEVGLRIVRVKRVLQNTRHQTTHENSVESDKGTCKLRTLLSFFSRLRSCFSVRSFNRSSS